MDDWTPEKDCGWRVPGLWRWLPHRLKKRRLPTTVHLRTQMIIFNHEGYSDITRNLLTSSSLRFKDGAEYRDVNIVVTMVSLALALCVLKFYFEIYDFGKLFSYRTSGLSLVRKGRLQSQSFRSRIKNAGKIHRKLNFPRSKMLKNPKKKAR